MGNPAGTVSMENLNGVANFGGTTVSVVDPDGNEVANLAIATPNHISTDGLGSVYVVNKAADNRVVKLTYTGDKTGGDTGTTNPGGDHATTPSLHDQQVAKAKLSQRGFIGAGVVGDHLFKGGLGVGGFAKAVEL